MLYGEKAEHKNKGIFVSVMKKEDGTLKLFCNGLGKKELYSIKASEGEKILFEKDSNARELEIPVKVNGSITILVNYHGRKASGTF